MSDADREIRFGDDGLVPVAIQDAGSGDLLTVAFMNREALNATRTTGFVHFWSRSRNKLWKKGETSGYVQRVLEIRINCDRNSLLIEVEQVGAVCHDGYDTCFYRRLEPDGSLTVVRDRRFDPRDVYGSPDSSASGLAGQTQQWWSAYEWLRDHNLARESSTSRALRSESTDFAGRIADELRELAGVLDGTHRHDSLEADLRLEAGQVLYWIACTGVYLHLSWQDLHLDRALAAPPNDAHDDRLLVKLLLGRAASFKSSIGAPLAPTLHDTIALIATVVASHGIEPEELIQRDLDDMRRKPYLQHLLADRT